MDVAGVQVSVMSPEDLVFTKVLAGRLKDMEDVRGVLGEQEGLDLAQVRAHIESVPGVRGAHDLHAWTLTSGLPVLSAHVVVDDAHLTDGGGGRVLDALADCLGDHFDVAHCTFQLEPPGHASHEAPQHT